jgi:hypothetical protein
MRLRRESLSIYCMLLLLLMFVASRVEGQEKVPPPTARDLTPDSSMKLALSPRPDFVPSNRPSGRPLVPGWNSSST